MDMQLFEFLSEFNARTNGTMNGIISAMDQAQWEKEFGGYFKSVKSLCNHIYECDWNWMKRFSGLREFSFIGHDVFKRSVPFGSAPVATIEEYLQKRAAFDAEIRAFVGELRMDDLSRDLTYTDSRGTPHTKSFGGLVLHMFNHQTHHRGMITLYMEEMGIENDFNDMVAVL